MRDPQIGLPGPFPIPKYRKSRIRYSEMNTEMPNFVVKRLKRKTLFGEFGQKSFKYRESTLRY